MTRYRIILQRLDNYSFIERDINAGELERCGSNTLVEMFQRLEKKEDKKAETVSEMKEKRDLTSSEDMRPVQSI